MSVRSVNASVLARLLGGPPSGRPLYAALARTLRGLVLDGRLPLRTRLPAERDLAAALGISRTTVTSAYDALRAEGYVESRQGAGTWTALPGGGAAARHALASDPTLIDLGAVAPAAPSRFGESVARAVEELPCHTSGTGYEPLGLPSLREAVAARYTARGVPTLPEQILVTTGAQSGLCLILQALVHPGDAVLIESPTYPHALDAFRRAGTRLVPAGVNQGWDTELMTGGLLRQAAVRLAYVIPDFQNPTGRLVGDTARAAFVSAARDAGAYVVADETFAELAVDDVEMPRPMAAHDTDGRVISVGSAAKVLWGGLRIGWIRATQALVRRLAEARETVDLASPVLEQLIVVDLLAHMDEIRAERRADLRPRRGALAEALRRECPDWEFTLPRGGLSLWTRLPRTSSTALAEAGARHGLHIVPGTAFGVDGVLDDHVRVPYVLPPALLEESAARLSAAAHDADTTHVTRRAYV